jgi:DNA-directed RNA polymerase specialized sigma24 family protein
VRHGAGQERVNTEDLELAAEAPAEELLAVNDALEKLATVDPKRAELVKLRYFAGFSIEDAARTMDISLTTANRWWVYARAWLYDELRGGIRRKPEERSSPRKMDEPDQEEVIFSGAVALSESERATYLDRALCR